MNELLDRSRAAVEAGYFTEGSWHFSSGSNVTERGRRLHELCPIEGFGLGTVARYVVRGRVLRSASSV